MKDYLTWSEFTKVKKSDENFWTQLLKRNFKDIYKKIWKFLWT